MNYVMQKYLTKSEGKTNLLKLAGESGLFLSEIPSTCVRIAFNDVVGCKM
jgi:hypothetical protein